MRWCAPRSSSSASIPPTSIDWSWASQFPLCETSIPPPVPGDPVAWGTDVQASFRVRACIDHIDDIQFQDDRLWIVYGGQYSAAGAQDSCPDRYKGRAYIGNQQWDISAMSSCTSGSNCAVSPT